MAMGPTPKCHFVPGLQSGSSEIPKIEALTTLEAHKFGCRNLWLRWIPKQSCNLCQDLSNNMWHDTCAQGNWVATLLGQSLHHSSWAKNQNLTKIKSQLLLLYENPSPQNPKLSIHEDGPFLLTSNFQTDVRIKSHDTIMFYQQNTVSFFCLFSFFLLLVS
jgi:hypothetical protein